MNPLASLQYLFFAVFGSTVDNLKVKDTIQPDWTLNLIKIVFGVYMMVSVVVLINLLIAMMTDTYQRIQVQLIVPGSYNHNVFSDEGPLCCSQDKPNVSPRVPFLCCIRANNTWQLKSERHDSARVDAVSVQVCVWDLHARFSRCTHQSPHCYDERHLPENTSTKAFLCPVNVFWSL